MPNILAIDDDSLQRASLRVALEKAGHCVRVAANGTKALRLMNEEYFVPALVITDMVMPEMDGLEVLQYFRQHHPSVPVVAISGELPETFLHLARRLGARAALSKPIRTPALIALVEELLAIRV